MLQHIVIDCYMLHVISLICEFDLQRFLKCHPMNNTSSEMSVLERLKKRELLPSLAFCATLKKKTLDNNISTTKIIIGVRSKTRCSICILRKGEKN